MIICFRCTFFLFNTNFWFIVMILIVVFLEVLSSRIPGSVDINGRLCFAITTALLQFNAFAIFALVCICDMSFSVQVITDVLGGDLSQWYFMHISRLLMFTFFFVLLIKVLSPMLSAEIHPDLWLARAAFILIMLAAQITVVCISMYAFEIDLSLLIALILYTLSSV